MRRKPTFIAYLLYRLARRFIRRYQTLVLSLLYVRYRFLRRLVFHYRNLVSYFLSVYFRFIKRVRFKSLRLLVFFMWRLWVRKVYGLENLPERGGAIIVSNHNSYYDFFVLASILKKQTVFIAIKGLNQRTFVGWFMKLDTIIYVDREKPGYSFFKEVIRHLVNCKLVVIYPEGTRSRTGKMIEPKIGFVKLALKANVPIIPIAMKGTYEILPPHRRLPALKKCEVYVGERIYISPSNPFLKDIFFRKKERQRFEDLDDEEISEIAFRIMNEVRKISGQDWDESALDKANKFGMIDEFRPKKVTILTQGQM